MTGIDQLLEKDSNKQPLVLALWAALAQTINLNICSHPFLVFTCSKYILGEKV